MILTLHAFIQGADAHHKANPAYRKGQAYCNWARCLYEDKKISFTLTPEEEVCWEHDNRIPDFLVMIGDRLTEELVKKIEEHQRLSNG